jgi:peroxiredoxin
MPEYFLKRRQPFNPLPYIVLAGIILGIVLASNLALTPTTTAALPSPTPTESYPAAIVTSTTDTPRVIKITPAITTSAVAQTGKPAPDFRLKTLDGNEIKLSDLRGKTVLINLWASWCPPCRYEMPGIQAAYEKFNSKGLVVLGINFTAQDNLQDVRDFVTELKLTFPILLDESGDVSAGLYGMRGLPTSYFIDTQGILQRIQVGAMLPEKIEEFLLEILPKS